MQTPPRGYPIPPSRCFIPLSRIDRIRLASVERLAPLASVARFGDGRYLLLRHIPNNRMLRWDEQTGGDLGRFGNRRTSPTATPETDRAGW